MFTEGTFQLALDKYRQGNFVSANETFRYIVDVAPEQWEARLYLAMTQIQLGDHHSGLSNMRHLRDNCPDVAIRSKAELSIRTISTMLSPAGNSSFSASGAAASSAASVSYDHLDDDEEVDIEVVWKSGSKKTPVQPKAETSFRPKRRFFWQR